MIAPPARPTVAPRPAPSSRGTAAAGASDPADAAELAVADRIASLLAHEPTPEDLALERQREAFDFITRVRAEQERELNALRDMAVEQMKHDDELLKKWIALI